MMYTKKEVLSIPNIMGYVRILLIPLFVVLYIKKYYVWSLVVLAANILTDFFDGIIARKFNQVTELGKLVDPTADKLTQAAVVITLAFTFPLLWPVFAIEFVKENMMLWGSAITYQKRGRKLNGAKWYGKIGTTITDFGLFFLLAFPKMPTVWANGIIITIGVGMVITLILYAEEFRRLWKLPPLPKNEDRQPEEAEAEQNKAAV